MGIQLIMYGYVEFSQDKEDDFVALLDEVHSDDNLLPFFGDNPFSRVKRGYRGSIVSFALSKKSNGWGELDASFKRFLCKINSFISASIVFEIEGNSKDIKIEYVFDGELIHRIDKNMKT